MDTWTIIGIIATILGLASSIGYFYDKFVILSNKEKDIVKGKPLFSLPFFSVFSKLSWADALKTAKDIAKKIEDDNYKPSVVIGIGRGGAIYGSLVSYNLYQVPIIAIDRKYNWDDDSRREEILYPIEIPVQLLKRVLLVAGEAHTGKTMEKFVKYLKERGASKIKTCVFYKQIGCTQKIDYSGKVGHKFMLMAWQGRNLMRDSRSKEEGDNLDRQKEEFYNKNKVNPTIGYIVRHAETDYNADGDRFIGITEAKLSENGKRQAEFIGNFFLKNGGLNTIYSSPQFRCIETANIIKSIAGGELLIDDNLKEMNYGIWEGERREDIMRKYPIEYQKYIDNPFINYPKEAEPPQNVIKRIVSFIQRLQDEYNTKKSRIAIITHKTTGRLMISYVQKDKYERFREISLENGSITKVLFDNDKINLEYENYTGHLIKTLPNKV